MTNIQILGSGCARCGQLTTVTEQAAQDLGLQYELEKVTDVMRYAEFGVMFTPALVVDGVVKLSGRVPSLDEARRLLGEPGSVREPRRSADCPRAAARRPHAPSKAPANM